MVQQGGSPADLSRLELLEAMADHVRGCPAIYRPSKFWEHFVNLNRRQIERHGLARFKRTLNQNYFNWLPTDVADNQFRRVAALWAENLTMLPFRVEFAPVDLLEGFFEENPFSDPEKLEVYARYVALLWSHVESTDPGGLTHVLEEPALGDPIPIRLGGRLISQDLANSLRERRTLVEAFGDSLAKGVVICEIGAGYGRLAYAFLSSAPVRYVIVDIPPALFVSQWYLSVLFPQKKRFSFSPWTNYTDVKDEFEEADIAFLTPDQLSRTPSRWADACLTVSTLGEMSLAQIAFYKSEMERIADKYVYIKQWLKANNTLDELELKKSDYDLSKEFWKILDRTDTIQDQFFETVWCRGPKR